MHHSTYQTRPEDELWSKTCVSVFVFCLDVNIHYVLSTLWRKVIVSTLNSSFVVACCAAWMLWIQTRTMPSRPRVIWATWLNGCWGISRRRRMVQDPGNSSLWRPHSWPPFSPCWWVPPLKCEKCTRSVFKRSAWFICLVFMQHNVIVTCHITRQCEGIWHE